MDRKRLDRVLAAILLASLWRNTMCQGSGDGPMCTTNAIFEYCLSEQGLDMSQSRVVLCGVDHHELIGCATDSVIDCDYNSPVHQEDFTKPYTDLLQECTGPLQCLSSPCLNGGSCSRYGTIEVCFCSSGFYGSECQYSYGQGFTASPGSSQCISSPCQNGGSCTQYGSSQICSCPFGFSGIRCEYSYGQGITVSSGFTQCTSTVCRNGGTCVNFSGFEVCQCMHGYFGQTCEILQTGPFPGTTDKPNEPGGIDIGTIAGIAIGGVAVILLFAIFIAIVVKKRRRKSALTQPQPPIPLNTTQSIHTPKKQGSLLPGAKIPSAPGLSKHGSPPIKPNQYTESPTAKEAPMRWDEDYIAPMADRKVFQDVFPGETEDGYTRPLPRMPEGAEDSVYADLEVYTELNENTMI